LDITENTTQAVVRVQVSMLSADTGSGQAFSMISSLWTWQHNNWYADVGNIPSILAASGAGGPSIETLRRDIETLKLSDQTLDIGRVAIQQHLQFDIPVDYSGPSIVDVSPVLPSNYIAVTTGEEGLSSSRRRFSLYVHTLDL